MVNSVLNGERSVALPIRSGDARAFPQRTQSAIHRQRLPDPVECDLIAKIFDKFAPMLTQTQAAIPTRFSSAFATHAMCKN
jgi:hypothetical protein